jgi:hypothetical protein
MSSLHRGIPRAQSLLVVGIVLLASALGAQRVSAAAWSIFPLTQGSAASNAVEFNPYGFYVAGLVTNNGVITAVRWDLLSLLRGGQPTALALPGTNGVGLSVNGAGQVGGRIGSDGAFWDIDTQGMATAKAFPFTNVVTTLPSVTDGARVLIRLSAPGFFPESAVADIQAGSLKNFILAPDGNTSFVIFSALAGDVVVGGEYSTTSSLVLPFRARIVSGTLMPLPTSVPTGYQSAELLFVNDDGSGGGYARKTGGPPEATRFNSDGTSNAYGIPAGYDLAYVVGQSFDTIVANASKSGSDTDDSVIRLDTANAAWMPLDALLEPNSGWDHLTAETVSWLGIVGSGNFRGQRTGFVLVPPSLVAREGTLTTSAANVLGGETVDVTFTFVNSSAKPHKIARVTLSDPTVAQFDTVPTGGTLTSNGKDLFVPLTDGQTQLSVRLRTTAASLLNGPRSVRIAAYAAEAFTSAQPFAAGVTELAVRNQ